MKLSFALAALTVCTFLMPIAARAQSPMLNLPTPAKSDETADAFVWVIAPEVGSRWQMRTFTRTESMNVVPATNGANASRVESVVIQRLVADYDVLNRDEFGGTNTRITMRDLDLDLTMRVNGQMIAAPKGDLDRMSRAIDGATFTVKQAPNGAIWNVKGLEQMQNRLMRALAGNDPELREQMMSMSKSLFSPDWTRKMMGQKSGTLPAYPIRVGESWAYAVDLPAGLPFRSNITGTRTINLLTTDLAYISDDALYSGLNSSAPIMMGNKKMVYDMSGLEGGLLGTSRVDRATGLTLESTLAQRLDGAMTLKQLDLVGNVKYAERLPLNIVTTGRVILEPR